jgi:hypothetical protein
MNTIFLLSPASCTGRRAAMLLRDGSPVELARRLRGAGATLGEIFTFLSGLYFRGKLAYARRFATPPSELGGVLVITPDRGLSSPDEIVDFATLRSFARVPVDPAEPRYHRPLARDVRALAGQLAAGSRVVLLGSLATHKYTAILEPAFGPALSIPLEFVGRGDMSRGGLMLRCVDDGRELTYVPLAGAPRHGPPPPRLLPRATRRPDPSAARHDRVRASSRDGL